ncbi:MULTISPECIES: GNAT family N-acetyltransferase [Glycomyces]|jgi:ribosomal-protein-alanine N-acetyltransferase|uniref:GNAT family N-acetyltransferase n=1 Tax=Glycomyces artemisiae TaxID=1076443 RepID=A0A2T0UTB7_9ACTN|nr:GNAT family protein [Glycomyces artemisiae]NUQ90207.1 GNAT family N-acetyltransferase [Glycomyces artemisiae]PRY61153.1 ribosomal-protein-alanine N-acetyltransferase [Glycomyces artemisiae]
MTLSNPGWPVHLEHEQVSVRPFRRSDANRWSELRRANEAWLAPWEPGTGTTWHEAHSPAAFRAMLRGLKRSIKDGTSWPLAVCWDGKLVGGLTVGNIVRRAFGSAYAGYWIDRGHAGRNITATALALVVDHALTVGRLHRIEVNIRPENGPSNRVAEKLGLRREGLHKRYLYIDGDWRDHYGYAVTAEEVVSERMIDRMERLKRAEAERPS